MALSPHLCIPAVLRGCIGVQQIGFGVTATLRLRHSISTEQAVGLGLGLGPRSRILLDSIRSHVQRRSFFLTSMLLS